MTRCYVLMANNDDFAAARTACQAFGGASDIVSYSTGALAAAGTQIARLAFAACALARRRRPGKAREPIHACHQPT
jgi:hypothetical protein